MPYVPVMVVAGSVEYVGNPSAASRGDSPMHLMDVSYKFVSSAPDAEFWRRGRYCFDLKLRRKKPDLRGRRWKTVSKSYFEIG